MVEISLMMKSIRELTDRYGLTVSYMDETDITLISKISLPFDAFIQIYANIKKEKINMALIVAGERIYGVDKEGGLYHEHPFDTPSKHITIDKLIDIEDFVVKCVEFLGKMGLIYEESMSLPIIKEAAGSGLDQCSVRLCLPFGSGH